tara:strand:+ start:306 stop:2174 length:1869 start_codon:yes stop_codon:yes gene_type:complete
MADINTNINAGIGARQDLLYQKAREEAAADAALGRQISDRLGGGLASILYGIGGGATDLYGNIAGMLGQEGMATNLGVQSDEMYRRALKYLEGKNVGRADRLQSAIGLYPGEREAIAEQLFYDNADARIAGYATPSLDDMDEMGQANLEEFNPFLQTSKPDIPFTRKEGESKDDFKNRILEQNLPPAQILQNQIDALVVNKGDRGDRLPGEAFGQRAEFSQEQAKSAAPSLEVMDEMGASENVFIDALADKNLAEGKEQPEAETRAELLEKYKQEFAEATGIEIDGKPDNSQALMAMGLALMQNRAGKGFNVGKMLSAVGEAGEKAMPYITKAASEAKAASVSAGKYALEKITNNENAEKAINAATLKAQRALDLQLMKMENDIDVANIKASGKSSKILNVGKLEPLGTNGGVTFRMGNIGGESKFSNAAADVGSVTRAWEKYTRGQGILSEMKTSLDLIENADSSALDGIYESVISSLDKLGIVDSKAVFEKGVGPRASFKVNRQSMINGFKRLLLQESQVSNLDLTTMEASFGEADIWSSIPKSQMAIDNMMIYFGGKKKTLEHPLTLFSDKDFYTSDKEYEKVMKHLESRRIGGFGGANQGAYISPSINVDGVSTVKIG